MAIQESTLRCGVCERETPHEIVYAGHAISEVHCLRCGARTRMDVSAEYPHELRERISSKPARLMKDLQRGPEEAVSLAHRTVSKPWRMVREMWEVRRSRTADRDR